MKATNILLILGLFCSCTQARQSDHRAHNKAQDSEAKSDLVPSNTVEQGNDSETTKDSVDNVQVLLQFNNLTITTDFEEVWNDKNYFAKIHKDTILVQLGLVRNISGQTYLLKSGLDIQAIQIFQNYETSLTIMDEGPHVDLTDWTHYVGDWKKLKIEDNKFKTLEYSGADQEKFPIVTSKEILEAAQKHLHVDSNRWTELAKRCTGPNVYPCGVSISRINLKIVLTDNKGITTEKYVILEIPMGC